MNGSVLMYSSRERHTWCVIILGTHPEDSAACGGDETHHLTMTTSHLFAQMLSFTTQNISKVLFFLTVASAWIWSPLPVFGNEFPWYFNLSVCCHRFLKTNSSPALRALNPWEVREQDGLIFLDLLLPRNRRAYLTLRDQVKLPFFFSHQGLKMRQL